MSVFLASFIMILIYVFVVDAMDSFDYFRDAELEDWLSLIVSMVLLSASISMLSKVFAAWGIPSLE